MFNKFYYIELFKNVIRVILYKITGIKNHSDIFLKSTVFDEKKIILLQSKVELFHLI